MDIKPFTCLKHNQTFNQSFIQDFNANTVQCYFTNFDYLKVYDNIQDHLIVNNCESTKYLKIIIYFQ
ncbi:hypothetical protein pb186bvf_019036, partial [Paramecium bursaria]